MRLDIAAGTAVRFEPGQTRDVQLVALAGKRVIYGFRGDAVALKLRRDVAFGYELVEAALSVSKSASRRGLNSKVE